MHLRPKRPRKVPFFKPVMAPIVAIAPRVFGLSWTGSRWAAFLINRDSNLQMFSEEAYAKFENCHA